MVYYGSQEVVHGLVASGSLLKLFSRACVNQPGWSVSLKQPFTLKIGSQCFAWINIVKAQSITQQRQHRPFRSAPVSCHSATAGGR